LLLAFNNNDSNSLKPLYAYKTQQKSVKKETEIQKAKFEMGTHTSANTRREKKRTLQLKTTNFDERQFRQRKKNKQRNPIA